MLWLWWKALHTERNPGRRTFTHAEQRFAARSVRRPGPDLLKPCWIGLQRGNHNQWLGFEIVHILLERSVRLSDSERGESGEGEGRK